MEKRYITSAMVELRKAITEAEGLSEKGELTKREQQRINVLLAKIAALRDGALAPDDTVKRWFRLFAQGENPGPEFSVVESRGTDILAGNQSFTYTQGVLGGFAVPTEFHDDVVKGVAQIDPLLDDKVVTIIRSKNFALRPYKVPGWDLSTFAATRVGESTQQNPQTVPTVSNAQLNGYTYSAALDASFEFEEDSFESSIDLIGDALGVGLARGIGADLVNGTGTNQPQGILTAAANSGVTTTAGGATLKNTDVTKIYFAVNRAYRGSKKCGWLMSDSAYQKALEAVDNSGRPLINVINDRELLLGKPVYITPSLPAFTTGNKAIIFGDLSKFFVRSSVLVLARDTQAAGFVEAGKTLYKGLQRVDSRLLDPTAGSKPPIVYATVG
jgi:HK97 family phage major capsid protein